MKRFMSVLILCAMLTSAAAFPQAQVRALASEGESLVIFNNFNKGGVRNRPTEMTVFIPEQDCLVTSILTYHWNAGKGSPPGTIGLVRSSDGVLIGEWAATGEPGMGGVTNANWIVYPDITLEKGVEYAIYDSDQSTWSQNGSSGGCGMSEVKGLWVPPGTISEEESDIPGIEPITVQPDAQAEPGLLWLLRVVPSVLAATVGDKVSFTAVTRGGKEPILHYWRLLLNGVEYMEFDFYYANALNDVTLSKEGTYQMEVTARDANGVSAMLLSPEVKVTRRGNLELLSVVPSASAVTEGERVSFNAVTRGGKEPIHHYWRLLLDGVEYMEFDFFYANPLNDVTLSKEGTYRMELTVRDADGVSAMLLSPEVKVRKSPTTWSAGDLSGDWAVTLTLTNYKALDPDVVNQTKLPLTIPQTWEVIMSDGKGGSVKSDFGLVSPGTLSLSGSTVQVKMAEVKGKGMTTWDGTVNVDGGPLSMSGNFLLSVPGEIEYTGYWSAVKTQ